MKAEEADINSMETAIEEHRQALAESRPAYPADIAFHMAIAEASKNPFAVLVLQSIMGPLTDQRMRRTPFRIPQRMACGIIEEFWPLSNPGILNRPTT